MTTDDLKKHFNENGRQLQARLNISRQLFDWWRKHGIPASWQIKLHKEYGIPL